MITSTMDLDNQRENTQESESQKAHEAAVLPVPAVGELCQLGRHSVRVLHRSTGRQNLHVKRAKIATTTNTAKSTSAPLGFNR